MLTRRLGLGTVQFGLDYGITNSNGQVKETEAAAILLDAAAAGIQVLDTASAYGASEAVLGRCEARQHAFRIITKTLPQRSDRIDAEALARIRAGFDASLEQLNVESVDGLLVHHAHDLLLPGGDALYAQLCDWRSKGKIGKVGVSIYDRAEAEALFERYAFDLVQLPLNLFDQRLLEDGTIAELHRRGVEIHVRSIFLQGVLLMPEGTLPPALARLTEWHQRYWRELAVTGVSPLAASLGFVDALPEVDVLLVGVNSRRHLAECVSAYDIKARLSAPENFAVSDSALIDPRQWVRS